jgi:hypothetical protein
MTVAYYHDNVVGERANIDVRELEFDDVNVEHLARHDVRPADAFGVLAAAPRFFRNLPDRAGTHVMIGPTSTGDFFYMSLAITAKQGVWRPVTAWRLGRRALDLYNKGVNT